MAKRVWAYHLWHSYVNTIDNRQDNRAAHACTVAVPHSPETARRVSSLILLPPAHDTVPAHGEPARAPLSHITAAAMLKRA